MKATEDKLSRRDNMQQKSHKIKRKRDKKAPANARA
jgi:hypothetical protein